MQKASWVIIPLGSPSFKLPPTCHSLNWCAWASSFAVRIPWTARQAAGFSSANRSQRRNESRNSHAATRHCAAQRKRGARCVTSPRTRRHRPRRVAMSLTLPLAEGLVSQGSVEPDGCRWAPTLTSDWPALFVCDLFWPNCNVAVEYDSDAVHPAHSASPQIRHAATRCRTSISSVITVTRAEYQNRDDFNRVARIIAKHLHKRIRIRDVRFEQRQIHLRKALAAQPTWENRRHAQPLRGSSSFALSPSGQK